MKDKILNRNSYILSFLLFSFYGYVFFQNIIVSLIISAIISIKFKRIFYDISEKDTKKKQMIMFRDFLDILSSSILSGNNFYDSIISTSSEITIIYSKGSKISRALSSFINDISNGFSQKDALYKFAEYLNFDGARIFSQTMSIGLDSGIDMKDIINNTKDQIGEKITMELEIRTILDNSKREFIIMMILPLIILILLNLTELRQLNLVDYITRTIVFIFIILSFYLGEMIVNLEV